VLVVGTDIPSLSRQILREAASLLYAHDVVLGPAEDGGFYLLGVRAEPPASMLLGTQWSTDIVLEYTKEKARSCGLAVEFDDSLPTLLDLDVLQVCLRC
jgi:uncharacterized protein